MLFELLLLLALGVLFAVLGFLIWKKEKIELIHSYHYDKVQAKDKGAYTALMGKGMILIGAGMILTGCIDFVTSTAWGWIAFTVCFIAGLSCFISAGRRYNR